jgi:plasmid stabilization system protein ParE
VSRIQWSRRALVDLLDIADFIARDNPAAAHAWVGRLRAQARRVASRPRTGRRVPELDRDDIRETLRQNYRIVYQTRPRGILVLTVFEGHRRLPPLGLDDD